VPLSPNTKLAAANLAANVFDMLPSEHLTPVVLQAPYRRLHRLIEALSGAESLVHDGRALASTPRTTSRAKKAAAPPAPRTTA